MRVVVHIVVSRYLIQKKPKLEGLNHSNLEGLPQENTRKQTLFERPLITSTPTIIQFNKLHLVYRNCLLFKATKRAEPKIRFTPLLAPPWPPPPPSH